MRYINIVFFLQNAILKGQSPQPQVPTAQNEPGSSTASQAQDGADKRATHCTRCNMVKTQYSDGNSIVLKCGKCGLFWCMINSCKYQHNGEVEVINHQDEMHGETRSMTNFNVCTQVRCACDTRLNVVYSNSDTIGKCRTCLRIYCLVPKCANPFFNLVECVSHQHLMHSSLERQQQNAVVPAICGQCGLVRAKQRNERFHFQPCTSCNYYLCAVGSCGYEFKEINEMRNHLLVCHQIQTR